MTSQPLSRLLPPHPPSSKPAAATSRTPPSSLACRTRISTLANLRVVRMRLVQGAVLSVRQLGPLQVGDGVVRTLHIALAVLVPPLAHRARFAILTQRPIALPIDSGVVPSPSTQTRPSPSHVPSTQPQMRPSPRALLLASSHAERRDADTTSTKSHLRARPVSARPPPRAKAAARARFPHPACPARMDAPPPVCVLVLDLASRLRAPVPDIEHTGCRVGLASHYCRRTSGSDPSVPTHPTAFARFSTAVLRRLKTVLGASSRAPFLPSTPFPTPIPRLAPQSTCIQIARDLYVLIYSAAHLCRRTDLPCAPIAPAALPPQTTPDPPSRRSARLACVRRRAASPPFPSTPRPRRIRLLPRNSACAVPFDRERATFGRRSAVRAFDPVRSAQIPYHPPSASRSRADTGHARRRPSPEAAPLRLRARLRRPVRPRACDPRANPPPAIPTRARFAQVPAHARSSRESAACRPGAPSLRSCSRRASRTRGTRASRERAVVRAQTPAPPCSCLPTRRGTQIRGKRSAAMRIRVRALVAAFATAAPPRQLARRLRPPHLRASCPESVPAARPRIPHLPVPANPPPAPAPGLSKALAQQPPARASPARPFARALEAANPPPRTSPIGQPRCARKSGRESRSLTPRALVRASRRHADPRCTATESPGSGLRARALHRSRTHRASLAQIRAERAPRTCLSAGLVVGGWSGRAGKVGFEGAARFHGPGVAAALSLVHARGASGADADADFGPARAARIRTAAGRTRRACVVARIIHTLSSRMYESQSGALGEWDRRKAKLQG
ncbi:hypothetical protein B0H15DRAFT_1027128 [Mycena belliarum]|uniref:Uncharacterized protein n=1 Tax=Mycena belliarum TaxID=1033014 RepID=A0AAD6TQ94_9AGAR|nr:hypothetical protein B0H15DRAFT_1027128 [Mycena belliae]